MDPFTIAALAGTVAPILTGAIGGKQASGAANDANNQLNEILSMYQNLSTPDVEQMKLDLAQYQDVYNYDPQMQQAEQLAMQDALQNVQLDPRLKQQQVSQLDLLAQIANGGFTPSQQFAMDSERRRNEADLTSRLKQIQANQDARGMGNADFALAQQVAETQSSANRQAQDNAASRATAFQQMVEAGNQGANLAGNMESADYNRQAALAQNLNNRELQNLQQRASVNRSNVDTFNDAMKSRAVNAQSIANQNTGLSNEQQQYNKQLAQQKFENDLKKAQGVAGARSGVAAGRKEDAQRTRDTWAGIGSGISSIAGGFMKQGAKA